MPRRTVRRGSAFFVMIMTFATLRLEPTNERQPAVSCASLDDIPRYAGMLSQRPRYAGFYCPVCAASVLRIRNGALSTTPKIRDDQR